jgi:predicted dehydrogenase
MRKINWAILGGGRMSKVFAETIFKDKNSNLVCIASKTLKNRIYFNKKYNKNHNKNFSVFKTYNKILNNQKVDIVYISLINKLHKEFILRCAKKKKNILVEKPAFLSLNDFILCKKLLIKNKIFFMEGMMNLFHPQLKNIIEIIKKNAIGNVLEINSSFGSKVKSNDERFKRILNDRLGGGAIYDLGCYPIVFSIIVASISENQVVKLKNFFGFSSKNYLNIDETAYAKIIFNNNIISNIAVSVKKKFKKPTVIKGTKGKILIFNPWTPDKNYKIIVYSNSTKKIYNFKCMKSIYEYQLNYANRQIFMKKYYFKDHKINWDLLENYIKILEIWKSQAGGEKKIIINFFKKINLIFQF